MKTNRPEDPLGASRSRAGVEWEHKQIACAEDEDLSRYVISGWELVTVVPQQNHHGWVTAYFKRPRLHASANRPQGEQI